MPNDNFIVAKNPILEAVKSLTNVLIGLLFIIIFFKFLIFLISFIYKTVKMVITELLRPFGIGEKYNDSLRTKQGRDFREISYADGNNRKKKVDKGKREVTPSKELDDLIERMNKKY